MKLDQLMVLEICALLGLYFMPATVLQKVAVTIAIILAKLHRRCKSAASAGAQHVQQTTARAELAGLSRSRKPEPAAHSVCSVEHTAAAYALAVTSLMASQEPAPALECTESANKRRLRKLQRTTSSPQQAPSESVDASNAPPCTQEIVTAAAKSEQQSSVEHRELEASEHAVAGSAGLLATRKPPTDTTKAVAKEMRKRKDVRKSQTSSCKSPTELEKVPKCDEAPLVDVFEAIAKSNALNGMHRDADANVSMLSLKATESTTASSASSNDGSSSDRSEPQAATSSRAEVSDAVSGRTVNVDATLSDALKLVENEIQDNARFEQASPTAALADQIRAQFPQARIHFGCALAQADRLTAQSPEMLGDFNESHASGNHDAKKPFQASTVASRERSALVDEIRSTFPGANVHISEPEDFDRRDGVGAIPYHAPHVGVRSVSSTHTGSSSSSFTGRAGRFSTGRIPVAPVETVINLRLSEALASPENKNKMLGGHPAENKNDTVERAMLWRAKLRQHGECMIAAEEALQNSGTHFNADTWQATQLAVNPNAGVLPLQKALSLQAWQQQNQLAPGANGSGAACLVAPSVERTWSTGSQEIASYSPASTDVCAHASFSDVAHNAHQSLGFESIGPNSMISNQVVGQANAHLYWDFQRDSGLPSWYEVPSAPEHVIPDFHNAPCQFGFPPPPAELPVFEMHSNFHHPPAADMSAYEMPTQFHNTCYQEALAATLSAAQPDHYED